MNNQVYGISRGIITTEEVSIIYINKLKIESTKQRPVIAPSVPTFDSGKSTLSNGDFGYNKRFSTRDWSFSTYDDVSTLVQADTHEIVIGKLKYNATLVNFTTTPLDTEFTESQLSFKVQPFAYWVDNNSFKLGSTSSTSQQTLSFRALGEYYSEPIIEVHGTRSGETTITIGDTIMRLSSVPGYLKIDCREYYLNVYDQSGKLRNDLLMTEFIRLHPGSVGVSMSPGISLEVTGNWREL